MHREAEVVDRNVQEAHQGVLKQEREVAIRKAVIGEEMI